MPVICWGPLGKSASDPVTISEYIAAKILNHDVNPSAHGLDGYSVYNHRISHIIDHPDYSIKSDKITSEWIVAKKFETSLGVGPGEDGVISDPNGIMMYQSGVRKVNIPKSGDAEFQGDLSVNVLIYLKTIIQTSFESLDGWIVSIPGTKILQLGSLTLRTGADIENYVDIHLEVGYDGDGIIFVKNPYFQTIIRLESATNQEMFFRMGGDMNGFGFQISNGTLSTRHYSDGNVYVTDISSGITVTDWHDYRAVLDFGVSLKFYVDGVLKNTVTTNLPTDYEDEELEWFRYWIQTKAAAVKRIILKNLLLVQDR